MTSDIGLSPEGKNGELLVSPSQIPHLTIHKQKLVGRLFTLLFERPKTSKTASVLKWIETNKVWKERYLMKQDNTIHKFSIKLSFSSKGQNKSKLEKQISEILI